MKSTFSSYVTIITLGIVCGLLVFLTTFMYVRYYHSLYDTSSLLKKTLDPILVTRVDLKNQWFEGNEVERTYNNYERIRIHYDASTYILERTPRVVDGILVGYESYHRVTPESIKAGSVVYFALETPPDRPFYTPLIVIDSTE